MSGDVALLDFAAALRSAGVARRQAALAIVSVS